MTENIESILGWGIAASFVLFIASMMIHEMWWKHRQSRRQAALMKQKIELTKIAMGAEMIMAVAPLLQAMDIAVKELEELESNE